MLFLIAWEFKCIFWRGNEENLINLKVGSFCHFFHEERKLRAHPTFPFELCLKRDVILLTDLHMKQGRRTVFSYTPKWNGGGGGQKIASNIKRKLSFKIPAWLR